MKVDISFGRRNSKIKQIEEALRAFEKLKAYLQTPPLLARPISSKDILSS